MTVGCHHQPQPGTLHLVPRRHVTELSIQILFCEQRPENIFRNGTVLIVVRHTAVVPRRRFTGNPTHPLRKDCPGSGGVAFSPGPVRLRAHRTGRQVRRWSVGHDAPGRPRRDKSRLVDSKAAGRALALGTQSRPAFKTKVKRSTT